jgi:hypothetical protein
MTAEYIFVNIKDLVITAEHVMTTERIFMLRIFMIMQNIAVNCPRRLSYLKRTL